MELEEYHVSLVKKGLAEVKAGRTLKTSEVRKRIAKLARKKAIQRNSLTTQDTRRKR
jgi:predicted transcriptional regulator